MEQREAVVVLGPNGLKIPKAAPISTNGSGPAQEDAKSTVLTIRNAPSSWDNNLAVPLLRLQGKWLLGLGWKPGQKVIVRADRDEIHITKLDGVEDPP